MPLPKRTGDEEDRIVRGGELPEDDGSLEGVVVNMPNSDDSAPEPKPDKNAQKKEPYELWSLYFIRRLADEGIYCSRDFETYNNVTNLHQNLKNRVKLSVHCHISQDYQLEYTNDPATNKKKPKFRLYSTHEQITLIHEDYGAGGILFTFTGGKVVNVGLNGNSLPDFLGHPILSKYENGKYDGEQAITDLVEYVKQIGLK